jgi:hypothetical protein
VEAVLKNFLAVAAILMLVAATSIAAPLYGEKAPQSKVLTGRIADAADNPLAGAVVYLTNTRTRAVKTYIAGHEGDYRFPGLASNTDYEVYAQFQGHKSDTKSVSQFDARALMNVNLKIDVK